MLCDRATIWGLTKAGGTRMVKFCFRAYPTRAPMVCRAVSAMTGFVVT